MELFLSFAHIAPYIFIVLTLVLSPGPDSILIIKNAIGSGAIVGLAAVAGVQVGLALHTILAITGITFAIRSSLLLFNIVVVAGSLYLFWLAISAWRAPHALAHIYGRKTRALASFRDALITNILNPKALLLFLAVMPSYLVKSESRYTLQLVFLSALLLVINTIWQSMLVFGARYAGSRLMNRRFVLLFNRICAAFLLFFAVLLFVENIQGL